jgi:penicillin-binding protein 1C
LSLPEETGLYIEVATDEKGNLKSRKNLAAINLSAEVAKRFLKKIFVFLFAATLIFFLLNFIFPLKVQVDYSQTIIAADSTVIHAFLAKDEKWRMMIDKNEISDKLKRVIIYKEDKYFYYHPGVNAVAVMRAAFNNIFHRRRTSGASTISMQVIRLLFPNERNYFNKAVEMFRAVQLELEFSKEEILRLYFNLIPYGSNVEGIKSASLLYFGRMPDKLSLAQLTALSVIPNKPSSLRPGKNNNAIVSFRNKWLYKMKQDKIFPDKEIDDALMEPLAARRTDLPKMAPHLANRLHALKSDAPVVRTTIDRRKQQQVNAITYNYSRRLKNLGIDNAAVLVVNNKTHAVEAYIGSPDFYDADHSGQVDGVTAIRSPGSALKPLVYALAFDKGLLTPKSVVTDVPVNFDGYAPENFNGKFNGEVTVEEALSHSLNVPAVKTLHQLGIPALVDKMKEAEFGQTAHAQNKLGLSLILGGCGVRLQELAGLFCAFANGGKYARLRFLQEDTTSVSIRLVSPASAFMISEILSSVTRPDLPNNFESSTHIPKIAWKTGTSYGRRDAWSIGYNKNYTVAVWVGNFSGAGVPELSGADMATPLLFEIFNTIDYNASNDWFTQPAGEDIRLVCPVTGKIPSAFCDKLVMDEFIPAVSSTERCDHLKKVPLSADEKYSYCTSCLPENGYKEKYFPNLAPELIAFYESEHISYTRIPGHNPNCTRIFSEQPPKIISPVNKKEYILEKSGGQLMLSCNISNEVEKVYWYVNDRLYKSCSPSEKIFFMPQEGEIKISCSDDKGRNADIRITVKYL